MKAILVIDMPSSCATCEIRWGCKIWNKWEGYNDRLDGCPLKPMPKKIPFDEAFKMEDYSRGWNACLEEIIGETE